MVRLSKFHSFLIWLKQRHFLLLLILFGTAFLLASPQPAQAQLGALLGGISDDVIYWLLGIVANVGVFIFGKLLLLFIDILIRVFQFNNFIDANAVTIGWVIVRDIANMFFIVGLLIIAFATIFRIESYQYKNLLFKFLIAALLVNFSKTIAGILIDVSQVIMLTFVNAFANVAAGNFTYGFGITEMVKFSSEVGAGGFSGEQGSLLSVIGAMAVGILMLAVAAGVILTMVVVLTARILVLWILVILSPLAYLANVFPGTQRYGAQWWSTFSKYLIVGPVLAFFVWLAMSILSTVTSQQRIITLDIERQKQAGASQAQLNDYFASEISNPQMMFDFMVTTGLLVAALAATQQIGVIGGQFAGKVQTALQKGALAPLVGLAKVGRAGVKAGAGYGVERLSAKTGIQFDPRVWAKAFKEHREFKQAERRVATGAKGEARANRGGRFNALLGAAGSPRDLMENVMGFKQLKTLAKGGAKKGEAKFLALKDETRKMERMAAEVRPAADIERDRLERKAADHQKAAKKEEDKGKAEIFRVNDDLDLGMQGGKEINDVPLKDVIKKITNKKDMVGDTDEFKAAVEKISDIEEKQAKGKVEPERYNNYMKALESRLGTDGGKKIRIAQAVSRAQMFQKKAKPHQEQSERAMRLKNFASDEELENMAQQSFENDMEIEARNWIANERDMNLREKMQKDKDQFGTVKFYEDFGNGKYRNAEV
jgi:hypothetical protein